MHVLGVHKFVTGRSFQSIWEKNAWKQVLVFKDRMWITAHKLMILNIAYDITRILRTPGLT